MTNKTFLSVHGIIYFIFAFALFLIPAVVWPMYGVQLNDQYAYFLSQHTSIFLGGIALISWLLREIETGAVAKKLFLALFLTNILGVAITLYATTTGVFVGFGWSDPIFFTLLSIVSYHQYSKQ